METIKKLFFKNKHNTNISQFSRYLLYLEFNNEQVIYI
jgi:hypothetical protein